MVARSVVRTWFKISLFLCIAALCMPGSVGAQSPEAPAATSNLPKFNIRAAGDQDNHWFEVELGAGERANLTATISNIGEVKVTVRSYAANASSGVNGGFSARAEEDTPAGATEWIDYPTQTYTMEPGTEEKVDFTVTVPEGTPAGEYIAALVVQTAEPVEIPGSAIFNQIIRSAISVEITVPGEMRAGFKLGEPSVARSGDSWNLDVPITNTGTTRLRPRGELVVTTTGGDNVSTTRVEMGWLYGGTSTVVRVTLPGQVPPGDYRVSLDLTDPGTSAPASIENVDIAFTNPETEEAPHFVVDRATVTPNGDPVRFADVSATITNNGRPIPTATIILVVMRDGEEVERYPLAENQALPEGNSDFDQRYIPRDDWQPGSWTFALVISAVSGGTETRLATVAIPGAIIVP